MQQHRLERSAVLFADVVSSVNLFVAHGDVKARELMRPLLVGLGDCVRSHRGTVVKHIGDAIMAHFQSADEAAGAAVAMQDLAAASSADGLPLSIRVGFHYGDVLREPNDIFGDTVNVAARLVASCKGRRILTTAETRDRLCEALRLQTTYCGARRLKGRSEDTDLYELAWEPDAEVTRVQQVEEAVVVTSRLHLECGGTVVDLEGEQPPLRIGREAHNDVVVDDKQVSREHATIEWFAGKFVLVDRSTNGTCVCFDGEEPFVLKDGVITLRSRGELGFGRHPQREQGAFMRFRCETQTV